MQVRSGESSLAIQQLVFALAIQASAWIAPHPHPSPVGRGALDLPQHPPPKRKALAPMTVTERIQPHCAAARRRVHEASFTHVDPRVIDAASAPEEHQIARRQPVSFHSWHFERRQLTGGARQTHADRIAEHKADQAGTIKATGRCIAAVAIRRTDQTDGAHQHVVGVARGDGIEARRLAAAAAQQQEQQGQQPRRWRDRAQESIIADHLCLHPPA